MAVILWTLVFLQTCLARAQSGDDESSVKCWSILSEKQTTLSCKLNDEDRDFEAATLCCESGICQSECFNATLKGDKFSIHNLNIFSNYKIIISFKDGDQQEQNIDLRKIVKIPTPEIWNVTYLEDEVTIHFKFEHFYVEPKFQIEIWKDSDEKIQIDIENGKTINIGGAKLIDKKVYKARVRAKPREYFNGSWTKWSSEKTLEVNYTIKPPESPPPALYVIILMSILVTLVSFVVVCWKKEIRAYLLPVIPHPKDTLAHIHSEKESLPISFSPATFKDITISRVDYADDNGLTSDIVEDYEELCCLEEDKLSLTESSDGEEPMRGVETSHLKIQPLVEHTSTTKDENILTSTAVPGYAKDETYVTMSSLYKTQ